MIDLFDTIPSLGDGGVRLAPLDATHAEGLKELMGSRRVYRYLPTFGSAELALVALRLMLR